MNGTLAVAARELRERRALFAAALVAGALALVLPLVSSFGRAAFADARELVALVFAAAFAGGVAAVVGGGMVTRELVERRLSFYFARPLSGGAIWGGKVAAAFLLAVGSAALALLPAAVAGRGLRLVEPSLASADGRLLLAALAGGLLLLVGAAHAASLVVRSRAASLLACDAAAALAVAAVVAAPARSLLVARAAGALTGGLVALAAALAAALLVGGWAQVSRGRTDLRRGHRALSTVLWGSLGVAALAFAGYARWVLGAGPADLVGVGFPEVAPRGSWIAFSGTAVGRAGYEPAFLLDVASGRSVRLDGWVPERSEAAFSGDGRHAAWTAATEASPNAPLQIGTLDLAAPGARPVPTTIVLGPEDGRELALSSDGRRLAVWGADALAVHDLPCGRLLAMARLPEQTGLHVFFLPGNGVVRVEARTAPAGGTKDAWKVPTDVRILELDVASRALSETGRIPAVRGSSFFWMAHDPEGRRVVATSGDREHGVTALRDGRTGAELAVLVAGGGYPVARFLADGRVVVPEAGPLGARLRVFTPDGVPAGVLELGPGRRVTVGREAAPGVVTVRVRLEADAPTEEGTLLLVDLAARTSRRLPAGYRWASWPAEYGARRAPGGLGGRLFRPPGGGLALLDPDAGTFRTVLRTRGGGE